MKIISIPQIEDPYTADQARSHVSLNDYDYYMEHPSNGDKLVQVEWTKEGTEYRILRGLGHTLDILQAIKDNASKGKLRVRSSGYTWFGETNYPRYGGQDIKGYLESFGYEVEIKDKYNMTVSWA